jgi:hypothetical protein
MQSQLATRYETPQTATGFLFFANCSREKYSPTLIRSNSRKDVSLSINDSASYRFVAILDVSIGFVNDGAVLRVPIPNSPP